MCRAQGWSAGGQSTGGTARLDLIPVSDMLRFNSHCNQVASRRGMVAGHCCLVDLISTLCTPTSAFKHTEKYALMSFDFIKRQSGERAGQKAGGLVNILPFVSARCRNVPGNE